MSYLVSFEIVTDNLLCDFLMRSKEPKGWFFFPVDVYTTAGLFAAAGFATCWLFKKAHFKAWSFFLNGVNLLNVFFSGSPSREDMYSQDSIDLLQNSGLQFKKHEEEGIDTLYFAELLMTSGLVLCENVKWLSFHRSVVCLHPTPPFSCIQ